MGRMQTILLQGFGSLQCKQVAWESLEWIKKNIWVKIGEIVKIARFHLILHFFAWNGFDGANFVDMLVSR